MLGGLGKILLIFGILLAVLGIVFIFAEKIPFLGRLPGDFTLKGKNYTVYIPIVTCLALSLIITVILNLFGKK